MHVIYKCSLINLKTKQKTSFGQQLPQFLSSGFSVHRLLEVNSCCCFFGFIGLSLLLLLRSISFSAASSA